MDNILRDEVNQHTSDEVEKVLAELEAQGVDLTAIKEALANAGSSGMKVKSIQHGDASVAKGTQSVSVTISEVDKDKSVLVFSFNDIDGYDSKLKGTISSNTTLLFDKGVKVNDSKHNIAWFVIEFE